MTWHPIPSYFPHILGKFSFSFFHCTGAWKGQARQDLWNKVIFIPRDVSPFYYTHFSCKTWHLGQLTAVPRPYIQRKGGGLYSNLGSFQLADPGSFQLSFMTLAFCVRHRCFTSREQVEICYLVSTVMYIFWILFTFCQPVPQTQYCPFPSTSHQQKQSQRQIMIIWGSFSTFFALVSNLP